ncbi:hypothetical protein PLICBS_001940 [Purpureocillium lilacinum]|uniref:uncharacterized protein n=1 Tax=Purpureocillium lilacinum TaxID=33203 RepID=UPI0020864CC6|nr:hypothetical protein PLICBS_001940 [Purpureocillium lilacinum]
MADTYSTKGLPPAPAVSMKTIPMAGLLVDVYGLDELPADMSAPVTCLWLLHPRTRTRARMADIAKRAVHAWNSSQQRLQQQQSQQQDAASGPGNGASNTTTARGLIALAFDMPNHGSRLVSEAANAAWAGGNAQHAVDMAGVVRGGAADVSALMDLVGLLTDRATKANLDTGSSPLLGSKYLPPSLIESLWRHDPRGILFGNATSLTPTPVPSPPLSQAEQERLRPLLDRHLRGKKLLLCSGGADELVPHARTAPLAGLLADAARGWYADGGLEVADRVYEGVGHHFSEGMVRDAVEFLVRVVGEGPRVREARARM